MNCYRCLLAFKVFLVSTVLLLIAPISVLMSWFHKWLLDWVVEATRGTYLTEQFAEAIAGGAVLVMTFSLAVSLCVGCAYVVVEWQVKK